MVEGFRSGLRANECRLHFVGGTVGRGILDHQRQLGDVQDEVWLREAGPSGLDCIRQLGDSDALVLLAQL
jgi:hypothetical protein